MGRPSCSTCLDSARGIVTMRRRLGCCLLISICGLAAGRVGGSAPPRRQPLANRFCDGRVQVRPWIFLASRLHLRGRVVQGVNAHLAIRSPVARPCVTVGLLFFFSPVVCFLVRVYVNKLVALDVCKQKNHRVSHYLHGCLSNGRLHHRRP